MPYDPPPLEGDDDAVTGRIFDGLASKIPGWVPVEGTIDTAIAEEVGRETALTNNRMIQVLGLGIVAIGETVFGLPASIGAAAEIEVEVTVVNIGDVIPQGFLVIGRTDVGVDVVFELLEAVVTTSNPETVTMHATQLGTIGNGVPAGPLEVVTATATVASATAVSPSSGGVEPETMQTYLGRLKDYLAILRIGAVRAADVEVLARSVPGVHRARALDLYDALSGVTTAERTATVFVIDDQGRPVSAATKDTIYDLIEGVREVNFVLYVEDPTYTALEVEFTAIAEPGAVSATVEAAVIQAISEYLNPATWGTTPTDPRSWGPSITVSFLGLAAAAGSAPGVSFLSAITLNGDVVDVNLAGPVGLPASTTDPVDPTLISGSVS